MSGFGERAVLVQSFWAVGGPSSWAPCDCWTVRVLRRGLQQLAPEGLWWAHDGAAGLLMYSEHGLAVGERGWGGVEAAPQDHVPAEPVLPETDSAVALQMLVGEGKLLAAADAASLAHAAAQRLMSMPRAVLEQWLAAWLEGGHVRQRLLGRSWVAVRDGLALQVAWRVLRWTLRLAAREGAHVAGRSARPSRAGA